MQVEILGALSVVCGDGRLRLAGKKVQVALAMLALNTGKVVSCDALVDELWGETPVANAKNALQAHIKRLRKLIASVAGECDSPHLLLQTVDNGYVLELPSDAIDVNRFLDLAARGAEVVERRPAEAVHLLQQALRLWRGPVFGGICEGHQCRAAAVWLEESRMIVHEDLITAQLALGAERRVVSQLKHMVARYPLRERLCEQLMIALYRCGRQAEALEAYHRVREQLTADLGLEPSFVLQQHYRAILTHDPLLVERPLYGPVSK